MDNAKAYTVIVDRHSFNLRGESNLGSKTTLDEQLSDEVLMTRIVQGDVAAAWELLGQIETAATPSHTKVP